MFRMQMGRIATRRTAYKRCFSSEASNGKSPRVPFNALALGLMLAGFVSLHVHIHTLFKKSDASRKEPQAKSDASRKEPQAKSDASRKEPQAKSDASLVEMLEKFNASNNELRADSDARFNAQLEQIKAITNYAYSSRMVLCQYTSTTSDEFVQCLQKELPHFDMLPAIPHKRDY